MLYAIARILMTASLRFFYRHLFVSGFEHIPRKGPVIIIANHHSSLMDAALIGLLLQRKAWFYARGDVFRNRFVARLLHRLHMLPVHAHQAGKTSLDINRASFAEGKKILRAGGVIVFFPESLSHTEQQLLPFRKGIFRLALEATETLDISLPVFPAGITYDDPVKAGRSVQVYAGVPLLLGPYSTVFRPNPGAVLLQVSREARLHMLPLVLHIDKKERLRIAELLLSMTRNGNPSLPAHPWKIHSAQRLVDEQAICRFINQLSNSDFIASRQAVDQYFLRLQQAGVKDAAVASAQPYAAWKMAGWWMAAPLVAIGTLLNGPPLWLARRTTGKIVSRQDFFSWIFVVLCTALYPVWLITVSLSAGLLGGPAYAAAAGLIMIVSGLAAHLFYTRETTPWQLRRWHNLPARQKAALLQERATLLNPLEK